MKNSVIELVTKFNDDGLPTETETFVTRQNISFALVYESVSFLADLNGDPDDNELHTMLDLVVRIFDKQFTKNQLINGLQAQTATMEIYRHIVFSASGKAMESEVEANDDIKRQEVNGWEDHKQNLKSTIQKMVKEGEQSFNDVLDLPFYFVFDELNTKAKDKGEKKSSMLDAFR